MRLLLDLPRTVITILTGLVATAVFGTAAIVLAHLRPTSPSIEKIIRAWARSWMLASGSSLETRGRENLRPGQAYVIVANHQSTFDIMACFLAAPVPIRFLAKKELFRIPILARAMRDVGIIEVDRQRAQSIHDQINRQARENIAQGRSLIIYPEGTRSRDGRIGPFKKGAFTIAIQNRIPVVPLTLYGTRDAWHPHSAVVHGGHMTAVVGEPIDTTGMKPADAEALRDQARSVIVETYRSLGGTT